MLPTITLYTTDHCSLCDQAFDWLLAADCLRGVPLQTCDVSSDDQLLDRLGPRVPVLAVNDVLLDWPFDEAHLGRLIAAHQASEAAPGAPQR